MNKESGSLHAPQVTDLPLIQGANDIREVLKARLVVREVIYHQLPGESPKVFSPHPTQITLEGDEEAYERVLKVTQTLVPILASSWVKEASLLLIENLEGKQNWLRNPTEEEKRELADKVVHVNLLNQKNLSSLSPGRSLRIDNPECLEELSLYSVNGPVRCRIVIVPR